MAVTRREHGLDPSSLGGGLVAGVAAAEKGGAGSAVCEFLGLIAGSFLDHFDVALVDVEALAIQPCAEGKVADENEENAGDHTGSDDGGEIAPARG